MSEDILKNQETSKQSVTPREHFMRYMRFLPWVTISVAICLLLAYVKIRYEVPIYEVKSKLLVTKNSPYAGSGEKFDDIFGVQNQTRINDEIEVIRSRSMAARVVKSLGLQTNYVNKGKIKSTHLQASDAPLVFEALHLDDSTQSYGFLINMNDTHYTIGEQPQKYSYGQIVNKNGVGFRVLKNERGLRGFATNIFEVSWMPLEKAAASLSGSINVSLATEGTNVIALSYRTDNIAIGASIINQYMYEYQSSTLEDKRETAESTLRFIDDQLRSVQKDLGGAEQNLQSYREQNQVFNPELQGQMMFDDISETRKSLSAQTVSLRVTDFLINYLSDEKNTYKKVSLSLGIDEPALLQLIGEFNRLQIERETALKTTPAGHPTIKNMESAIERLRADLVETLQNVRKTQNMLLNDLVQKNKAAESRITSIPLKERRGNEVERQQVILRELYQYLLQKKLETSIASASTISNIKVMESAMSNGNQVSPNKRSIYIIAFLVGVGLPGAIIFLIDYLNDKVKNRIDIQNLTETPILGEIGHSAEGDTGALVVSSRGRSVVAEQFRIVRSNLAYILPGVEKPVIMVTSTYSGEGKSFVSTNIGGVIALSGKKTVILEFDIRKPKILKGLKINDKFKGITNFVIGANTMEEIIYPVPDRENLYIIPCGPIPPNPSEMLLSPRIAEMFAWLKANFDAIIIDTAPVGLVSDAITLGQFADCAAYIVRHNYTNKKQILLLDDLYRSKKLPHLSVIINDIRFATGYGSYYAYSGYGYGHGYGYGYVHAYSSDYFDHEKPNGQKRRKKHRSPLRKLLDKIMK